MTAHYIVIGNGIAGLTAAETLRAEDEHAQITVIADDPCPTYYRPALKDYLAGRVREEKLWARPTSFYQDRRIRFLHERVIDIQAGEHLVELSGGRQSGYHRLLLACGARAARLHCPGNDLPGVATLRTIADYQAVMARLASARRIVVSGSGTLALETIETLRQRGFPVTHLVRRRTLWSEVLDLTASDLVLQQERRDGVDVRLAEEIAEITGKQGQVNSVLTTTGARIPCELVLIAIGVEPVTDLVTRAGIPCTRGLRVDEAMHTAAPDIYAAGDVLETTDAASGRTRVIGQWYPAVQQARAAAYSMLDLLDSRRPFDASACYNATFLYGLDFACAGLTQIPPGAQGYQEIVADPQPRAYRKIILKGAVPVGMLAIGERRGTLALKRAMDHRVDLTPVLTRVFAAEFQLHDWLDQQGVPPAVPDVSRREIGSATQAAPAPAFLLHTASAEDHPGAPPPHTVQVRQAHMTTIGRQAGVTLLIDHASVSRRHAQISPVDGHYVLRDLGSANGTSVNDAPLPPGGAHPLQAGDRLQFGRITYLFQAPAAAAHDTGAQTRLVSHATGFYDPLAAGQLSASSAQPRLNADGSLLLPGAQEAIAASVVATFQRMPVLIALVQGRPRVFPLLQGTTLAIGRDRKNTLVLPTMAASRTHAEVFVSGQSIYLRDLGSSNGVQVNATSIDAPYRLAHGDRILIGGIPLYFLHQAADEVSPGPGPTPPQRGRSGRVCPTCGSTAPVRARFCAHCAASLGQSVPASH